MTLHNRRLHKMNPLKFKSYQNGLTLIEVIISLAIALLVLSLVINSLLSLNRAFVMTEQQVRIQESLRFSQHQLQFALNQSQFWFHLQSSIAYAGSVTLNQEQSPSCHKDQSLWAYQVWQPIVAQNNKRTNYDCISASSYRNSDILTIRYLQPATSIDTAVNPYIRLHQTQAKVFRGEDERYEINQFPGIDAKTYAVISQTFYIASTGRTCNGAAIPALYRKYLVNGLPKTEEIVSGIEHLELLFDIDQNLDGIIDNQLPADHISNWNFIKSVSIHLIARSECELAGPATTRKFNVADTQFEFSDSFLRESLVFTVAL
ncbi:prepilin-type N-terminal cleavage/methylation domain-containing protein [Thalassotalea litorea]|uniref:Prepilin-type N-terminal cleavage/methylation domain-containing protein n=1 Tax=Thalassotalea litorea TaxID=2020715 RepID=A0A5R9IDL5_9GAMM|nr:PilW family protein [Thalassotalea litorea]TLU61453.1 prepilin-type N-terminal cleavage/methylation domain-containing protein [Thalassotalea litorea]